MRSIGSFRFAGGACSWAAFTALAWVLASAGLLKAQTSADTILLRSRLGHGGSNDWFMERAGGVLTNGEAISQMETDAHWQPAIVPGTVLNSLVYNGVYPEPYFGLNNAHEQKLIPDLSETGPDFYTYWFRTQFSVPAAFKGRQVWLQFDGVNYRAEFWLNGHRLGDLAGMFQRGIFNASEAIQFDGSNVLAVLIRPLDVPGGFKQKDKTIRAAGENRNGGDGEIGREVTMLMSVGWDFTFPDGIRDRNTGIWRDVKLFATGPVVLRNPFVKSRLPLPALAPSREEIQVDAFNATDKPQEGELTARVPEAGISIKQHISLNAHETRSIVFTPEQFKALIINHPRLWWPLNKGEPFLHHLELEFAQGGKVSDRSQTRFGIREISSDRNTPDKSRQFFVNGRRFFVDGSNWVPEAMCRGSEERTEAELRYTKQAGVNFLRLWAGGIAESDHFFEVCDELGILVWMEFWQTGDAKLPDDPGLYRANVADTILRLRNHASLAYYVAANERPAAPNTNVDSTLIVSMKDLVDKLDPTHGWQQSSEADGVHDGSPYMSENPMWYYENTGSDRGSRIDGFCPEYGCPTLPTVDCLREMMDEKDLWPPNKTVWDYLDGGGFHGMTGNFNKAVEQYGPSQGIEQYAMKAQAFGGLAYRAIWECWNENKFDYGDRFCSGVFFWYHNSPNRQVCGRMWDWSLEPTAALYFSQHANEPRHAQFDFLKNTVNVNNQRPEAFAGTVTARVFNLDMREVLRRSASVKVGPEGLTTNVLSLNFPTNVSPVHFIKLDLADAKGRPVSDNFYWRSDHPYKMGRTWTGPQFKGFESLASLPQVALKSHVRWQHSRDRRVAVVTVANPSLQLAFLVWLRLQHTNDAKPIRPAFYDDNFVSLLPGESRVIRIEFADREEQVQVRVDGWNILPQVIREQK